MTDLTLSSFIHIIAPLLAGAIGVGVGWGVFKVRMDRAEKDIETIKEHKTWDTECNARHQSLDTKVGKIDRCTQAHGKALTGLQNFARWILTKKEGLSLSEVNKIINGG